MKNKHPNISYFSGTTKEFCSTYIDEDVIDKIVILLKLKLAGYTARIAGLMHIAEHERTDHLIIQKATMEKAVTFARLLMEHVTCPP